MSSICVSQVTLSFSFRTLWCFGDEHKNGLFCELDLGNDKAFLSKSLDLGHLKA